MQNNRLTIYPINRKYESIWKLYKIQMAAFWTAEELRSFQKIIPDFEKLKNQMNNILLK
jgi:ribonucleotide reductase beta subunit family protein with ferritin-like domain